jgi:hypothetical protein
MGPKTQSAGGTDRSRSSRFHHGGCRRRHSTARRRCSALVPGCSLSLYVGTSTLVGRPGISFGDRSTIARSRYARRERGTTAVLPFPAQASIEPTWWIFSMFVVVRPAGIEAAITTVSPAVARPSARSPSSINEII